MSRNDDSLKVAKEKQQEKFFSQGEKRAIGLILLITLIGGLFHWYWIPLVNWRLNPSSSEQMSSFGEAYIIFHAFFDMLAWAVLIVTIVVQFRDMRHRDEHFAMQMEAQRIQSVFLPYLSLFQACRSDFYFEKHHGQRAFAEMQKILVGKDDEALEQEIVAHKCQLTNYHRHIEVLVECIVDSHLLDREKNLYLNVLRAQLSTEELVVICICRNLEPGLTLNKKVVNMKSENPELQLGFLVD